MSSKPLVVFDIDGTIANPAHRLYLIQNSEGVKNWDAFYAACTLDDPIPQGIAIVRALHATLKYQIEFWTGRRESVRSETIDWLTRYVGTWATDYPLRMRKDGDWRTQREIKESYIGTRKIYLAFDDWEPVVAMYREKGIITYQVSGATIHVGA